MSVKIRAIAGAVTAAGVVLLTGSPASAHAYDHEDPYRTGCNTTARAVRTASIESRVDGTVGTIKLMWSSGCRTNWTEIWTGASMRGTISVTTDRGGDRFTFRAGNGGHHWGNMMYAPGVCAWGSASVQWGSGAGGQNGSGTTGRACG
ncbi:DUF2690 domain-containing protein [Streptosporangium sp. CA-135522]|uniref:DUF2690 domain-containing protein n=1 Tax=Streptosporangium sp. CA-135522 TaxID=3240072 RepID=UPI003D8CD752